MSSRLVTLYSSRSRWRSSACCVCLMARFFQVGAMCSIWCPGGFSCDSIHVHAETKLFLQSLLTGKMRCGGTTSHDCLSSTKWIGALVVLILFSESSLQTWCDHVASRQSDPDDATYAGCGGSSSHSSLMVEDLLEGVIDIIRWKAIYNKGFKR